ncbi:MAG: hypothetical protein K8I30_18205 [Anaerolineae bacterium]|nr:hypothetical protein [Anaerolineae bacterium]
MSDTITLEVHNRGELENLARSKGYATVQDYLLALIAADQNGHEETLTPAERFREGWREVLAGDDGIPYDEMWEGIDDDNAES